MAVFEILRNVRVVAELDTESQAATIMPGAPLRDDTLLFCEEDEIVFRLSPDEPDLKHRIFVGDVPLAEMCFDPRQAEGNSYGDYRAWMGLPAFESARGHTEIRLESAPAGAGESAWRSRATIGAYVLPTKIGEERYQAMSDQVQELSRSLVVDLYGKSRRSVDTDAHRDGRRLVAPHQEMQAIERTVAVMATVLQELDLSPVSRITRSLVPRTIRHGTRVTHSELNRMHPDTLQAARTRPVLAWVTGLCESYDVPEHRVILGFLRLLQKRARYCARAARRQRERLEEDRELRGVRMREGPTLYETMDLPKIRRLSAMIGRARVIHEDLETLCLGHLFRDVRPDLAAVRGGAFTHGAAYGEALAVIRDYVLKNAVWTEVGDDEEVVKLTSRIFEQWSFIKLVDAFRSCGIKLAEWKDEIRHHLQAQFVLDFDRGTEFVGRLEGNRRLRFRYEPWIRNEVNARALGESLCRGGRHADVSWSPDIVIEYQVLQEGVWVTTYGIVMDAKYSRKLRDYHWNQTLKYQQIRNTDKTARQVIRQLWLILPAKDGRIDPDDPAIEFGEDGPSCLPDESSRFVMAVDPLATDTGAGAIDVFAAFASGTVKYLERLQ